MQIAETHPPVILMGKTLRTGTYTAEQGKHFFQNHVDISSKTIISYASKVSENGVTCVSISGHQTHLKFVNLLNS